MIKRVLSLLIAAVMVMSSLSGMTVKASAGGLKAADIYTPAPDEAIQDPVLHWAVRSAMNSIDLNGQKLTKEMVASSAVRDICFAQCANPDDFLSKEEWKDKPFWIENLEGLQYATSAKMVEISFTNAVEGKRISDLSPLANLTQLEILILKQDGIDDISPLRNLVNLTQLDLYSNNAISNIDAVAGMTKLKSLKISNNAITNVDAISNLEALEWVAFSNNKISSLPDLSKLTNVYFLDAENNCLTNSDVEQIAKMRGLTRLNLLENEDITDYRPLVNLTKLTAETTYLDDETKKSDLFAAIEVNKLFEYFNISKMRPEDLQNVEDALAAYENLTDEQKTYMDSNKIAAAKSNKELVASGKDPVDYPEYDTTQRPPEFKEIKISVTDKYGKPMKGVSFQKKQKSDGSILQNFTTDEKGRLVITHLPIDNIYGVIAIVPAKDDNGDAIYVAEPAEITYTVSWEKETKTINGKKATGLEELKMILVPVDEYVDKTGLKDVLARTEAVESEYKYTIDSYKAYKTALNTAQLCFDNPDATEKEVTEAASALNNAIDGLTKSDVLTQLKIKVVDTNGNTFHRAFKFQVRIPETDGEEAWNDFTSPYSGTAYLKASPGWSDGKEWEILASDEEPYEIEPFRTTIGVKDGQVYFKTVEGKTVDADFEKVVAATYIPEGAVSKTAPDKQIVEEIIAYANELNLEDYTETTAGNLKQAVNAAKAILQKADAVQEDYNEVIADILEATDALAEAANKVWLEEELAIAATSYKESYYTKESWAAFEELLAKAQAVYDDGDATQAQVEDAIAELKAAEKNVLVRVADNSALGTKLEEAKAIKGDAYTEDSFKALTDAIAKAQAVYDNDESTQEQIAEQVTALDNAIKALVEKTTEPVEAEYACTQGVFKAKVVNKDGNPVAGVTFESVIDGNVDTTITSDANGIITYQVYGQNNKKVTYIRLADERYTTEDEHYFEASGAYDWTTFITAIDGQAYEEGIKLTYTVTEAGEETPEPEVNNALVLNTISVTTENIKAPGEVELKIQLEEESSSVLHGVRLVFVGETNPDRFLYYWVDAEDIRTAETEGEYRCTFDLAENVVADTYVLNEIELCDQEDQRRNYALDSETGLLKDWSDGYEIEAVDFLVTEGCMDTDFDAPLLQNLSYDRIVYTGETLEVSVTATDASGVENAFIVFYNNNMEQYLYLNACKTTDLGNGKYKFLFEIHPYQYADSYQLDAITLTDASMYHNSISYWVDDSELKNEDGKTIPLSTSYKYLTIVNKSDISWATTYTNDLYPVVSDAKEKGIVAVIGGDSDGSQWILDKRVLNAAKLKKLTLILADTLTHTEIIIDAANVPSELADETYAGLQISEFANGYFNLKLQMTNADIPFQVKFKTKELEGLKDKVFTLEKVTAEGNTTTVSEDMIVDYNGYLNVSFPSGIESGDDWSHFRLIRNENPLCENGHTWGERILGKAATLQEDGQEASVCGRCGAVERKKISKVSSIVLAYTKYIYNGNVRKPAITIKDAAGKKLVNGTDYAVSYATGRKNVGRYAVKVTLKGKYSGSFTKYFTIVPKAVTNLKAIRYQYGNKVRLSWTKSLNATGYRIYRKKANASSYTYLGATKNAYYINSGLTKNTAYRYKVIPYYKTSSGTTHYYSTNAYKTVLINTVKKGNKLSQVTKVKAAKSGTRVKVSWKNVSYETGYQISRSTSKTGTNIVATYKTTSGTSKSITATKNKTYYYKVRAYRVVNGKKIFGAWSTTVKFTRK